MQGVAVGLGIHRYRRNSHPTGGLDHPAGNLAAICNQNFLEHLAGFDPWAGLARDPPTVTGPRANLVLERPDAKTVPAFAGRARPAIWHAGTVVTIASIAKWAAGNSHHRPQNATCGGPARGQPE